MKIYAQSVTFTASDTSAVIAPQIRGPIVAVQTPASFTSATLDLLFCQTSGGAYLPVKDADGAAIQVAGIDTTNAAIYDLTNIFPLGIGKMAVVNSGYLKLKAASSQTATIVVYFLGE